MAGKHNKTSPKNLIGQFFGTEKKSHISREKDKARQLRKTTWWQNRLQRGICYYCTQTFPQALLTLDHLIPLSRGGYSVKGNCVIACKPCNTKKKDLTALEWRSLGMG